MSNIALNILDQEEEEEEEQEERELVEGTEAYQQYHFMSLRQADGSSHVDLT
jgi:hypothetical protein